MESTPSKPAPKPPKPRTVYLLVAFFLVAGVGLLAGGAYAWHDEHSGTPGTAHIYKCYHHTSRYGGLDCYARWTANDRVITGYVENAKASQLGKDVSVRIHAHHVTETTYWVPILLWVFGLFVIGVFTMVLVQYRRRNPQPT